MLWLFLFNLYLAWTWYSDEAIGCCGCMLWFLSIQNAPFFRLSIIGCGVLVLVAMVTLFFPGGQSQDADAGLGCRSYIIWFLILKNNMFSGWSRWGCCGFKVRFLSVKYSVFFRWAVPGCGCWSWLLWLLTLVPICKVFCIFQVGSPRIQMLVLVAVVTYSGSYL